MMSSCFDVELCDEIMRESMPRGVRMMMLFSVFWSNRKGSDETSKGLKKRWEDDESIVRLSLIVVGGVGHVVQEATSITIASNVS